MQIAERTEVKTTEELALERVRLQTPEIEDGRKIWELVKSTGILDVNSLYSYLMMCEFFQNTTVVAKAGSKLIGFITSYISPEKPDTVFVWQIAVAKEGRGQGLGTKMLKHLMNREVCDQVKYLEATVSPSNIASKTLFQRFAKNNNTLCKIKNCFSEELFPAGHEEENLFRVGPFKK